MLCVDHVLDRARETCALIRSEGGEADVALEVTEEEWDRVMAVDLKSMLQDPRGRDANTGETRPR